MIEKTGSGLLKLRILYCKGTIRLRAASTMDRARKLHIVSVEKSRKRRILTGFFFCARDPRVSLLACRMDIGQDFSGSEALTQVVFQKKKVNSEPSIAAFSLLIPE